MSGDVLFWPLASTWQYGPQHWRCSVDNLGDKTSWNWAEQIWFMEKKTNGLSVFLFGPLKLIFSPFYCWLLVQIMGHGAGQVRCNLPFINAALQDLFDWISLNLTQIQGWTDGERQNVAVTSWNGFLGSTKRSRRLLRALFSTTTGAKGRPCFTFVLIMNWSNHKLLGVNCNLIDWQRHTYHYHHY